MISDDTLRARLAGLDPAADLAAPDLLDRVDLETPDDAPRRHWGQPLILAAAAVALVRSSAPPWCPTCSPAHRRR
ncbi:MAG: hypothetical protein U0R27_05845 [Candidatus Nanopelagicales bacterium]